MDQENGEGERRWDLRRVVEVGGTTVMGRAPQSLNLMQGACGALFDARRCPETLSAAVVALRVGNAGKVLIT